MALSDIGAPGAGTLYVYGLEDAVEDSWDTLVSRKCSPSADPQPADNACLVRC